MFSRFLVVLFGLLLSSAGFTKENNYFVSKPEVKLFIAHLVEKHHFKKKELVKLFKAVKVRPSVMHSISHPLEERPWYTYEKLFVTEWRIREGVEFWKKNNNVLSVVEKKYGVPASVIVATIGVETKYGKHTGEYPVIDALANIGFSQSSRAKFFRSELEEFLLLAREQHLNPLKVMGSYAGAIGQPQFMPSSYRRFAVSFSGHSKIDLSHNEKDIIASIANYYRNFGWKMNDPVAIPASVTGNKHRFFLENKRVIRIAPYASPEDYGIVPRGAVAPNQPFKLILLRGYWGNEYWLAFHNFDVIKRYNSSDLYAMAVFQLSRYISNLKERLQND